MIVNICFACQWVLFCVPVMENDNVGYKAIILSLVEKKLFHKYVCFIQFNCKVIIIQLMCADWTL